MILFRDDLRRRWRDARNFNRGVVSYILINGELA